MMLFVESIWRKLNRECNSALRRKLDIARKTRKKEITRTRARIYLENARNLNSSIIRIKLLDMHLQELDHWANTNYLIYRDVWRLMGNEVSPEFLRTVYSRAIRQLITIGGNTIINNARTHAVQTGISFDPTLEPRLRDVRQRIHDLNQQWEDRVETEAMEIDPEKRQKARQSVAAMPRDARAGRPSRPPLSLFDRVAGEVLDEQVRVHGRLNRLPTRHPHPAWLDVGKQLDNKQFGLLDNLDPSGRENLGTYNRVNNLKAITTWLVALQQRGAKVGWISGIAKKRLYRARERFLNRASGSNS